MRSGVTPPCLTKLLGVEVDQQCTGPTADGRPTSAVAEQVLGQPWEARDSAIAATAVACCKILDHDEEAAAAAIADHLARHPLTDASGEARLRRNPAIAYVASESVRQHWDAAKLGPMHRRARALARTSLPHEKAGSIVTPSSGRPPVW